MPRMINKLATAVRRQLAGSAWQSVAALGLLSAAAWTIDLTAGLAAAGVSLLLLDWRADQ